MTDEMRERIADKLSPAFLSPPSGPVKWSAEKLAALDERVSYLTDAILALIAERLAGAEAERDAALAKLEEAREVDDKPVAWRVKDFADDWILCHDEAQALAEAEGAGNLVEPLFRRAARAFIGGGS